MAEYDAVEGDRWVGWIAFAGILMIIGGFLQGFYGLVAILNDEWVVWGNTGAVYLDITQWGWVHIVLGLVLAAAGIALFFGKLWARVIAVIAVAVNMVTQMMNVPIYPFWSLLVIALDVLIIWALTVHGDAMANA